MRALKRMLLRSGLPVSINNRRLCALRNCHKGRKAFFIGMGPSLKVEDLEKLNGQLTFACNKIYLCFEETAWRPDYYSVVDILVAENNATTIEALECDKILDVSVKSTLASCDDAIWVNGGLYADDGGTIFQPNPFRGFGAGATVLYFQLQLAWFMGIREFYLLGLDFSFKIPKKVVGDSLHGEVLENDDEVNHFHPDYRKKSETWTMPNMEGQRAAFSKAREFIESRGGRIWNCSRTTKLDVIETESLENALRRR